MKNNEKSVDYWVNRMLEIGKHLTPLERQGVIAAGEALVEHHGDEKAAVQAFNRVVAAGGGEPITLDAVNVERTRRMALQRRAVTV